MNDHSKWNPPVERNRNGSRYVWKIRIERKSRNHHKVYRYFINGLNRTQEEVGDILRESYENYFHMKHNSLLQLSLEDLEHITEFVRKLNNESY